MRFVLLVAVSLAACSLLVSFDPQTQPCDAAGECLPGFQCINRLCKFIDGGVGDGGSCKAAESNCGDGVDDDCDGKKDCEDGDCALQICNDGSLCTSGERCKEGACVDGVAKACNTPGSCQAGLGTCDPNTGNCQYGVAADGTRCGSNTFSSRCCGGVCVDTSTGAANCGGCGLACGTSQRCIPLNQSSCATQEPIDVSGRCSCDGGAPCPAGQTCTGAGCSPSMGTQCAGGQIMDQVVGCTNYCRYP